MKDKFYLTLREISALEILEKVTAGSEHGFQYFPYKMPSLLKKNDSAWGRGLYYYPLNGEQTISNRHREFYPDKEILNEYEELIGKFKEIEYPLRKAHEKLYEEAWAILTERHSKTYLRKNVRKTFYWVGEENEKTIEKARLDKIEKERIEREKQEQKLEKQKQD
jgi:hypothetical protein